jgi:Protein of unknown function (DUF3309)
MVFMRVPSDDHAASFCAKPRVATSTTTRREAMTVGTILLIILILLLIGALPAWPHSRGWGYGPTGGLGVVVLVLVVLLLMGRI